MKAGDFMKALEPESTEPVRSFLENWRLDLEKFPIGRGLEADFFHEVSSFTSQLDPRLTLFNILKERGGGVSQEEAASLLESFTEADIDELLRESCRIALNGFSGRIEFGVRRNEAV